MSSSRNSSSISGEHAKAPCMANVSHILGRDIVYDEQTPQIQEKIREISAMEDQLVQLVEKGKTSDSVLDGGLTVDYLHLFKEYQATLHDIDTELRSESSKGQDPSPEPTASAEQLERWSIVLAKSSIELTMAILELVGVNLDGRNRDQAEKDVARVIKIIGTARRPIEKVGFEIEQICPREGDVFDGVDLYDALLSDDSDPFSDSMETDFDDTGSISDLEL
ncbi:hypothetical protein F4804DRAFT_333466 [Jackrogersella minutella]|nr:hypothetical protein F4804DRAFT_333466 [Jackrogersella minutella]